MGQATISITDNLYEYLLETSLREPSINAELRRETLQLVEHSQMMTSPEQAQFIGLLVEMLQAKRAIEIGVFTGYTSLAIAQALPENGLLVACDQNEEWPNIGKPYWQRARVDHKIQLRIAQAETTLQNLLEEERAESFDFIYIDADKNNYPCYYELALKLLRRGGLIVLDNVLLIGDHSVPSRFSAGAIAVDELNKQLLKDERVTISMLPIREGLTLVRKR